MDRGCSVKEALVNSLGILTVPVGFAPMKPAEFLTIKIQQQTART